METPRKRSTHCFGWFLFGLFALLLFGLLVPSSGVSESGRRGATRETVMQIVTALRVYQTEYGHLPGNRPDGRYEDAAGNAQIFAVLRALDSVQNPRKISYFEARNVKNRQDFWGRNIKPVDGFIPATGVLLDPYGQPYRIRVTPRLEMHVDSPYADVPTPHSEIFVWSLGPDGKQGNLRNFRKFTGSDDIYQGLP